MRTKFLAHPIAVDSGQTIVEKDEPAKRATIRLPQPGTLPARVDHKKARIWEVKTAWIPSSADQDSLRDTVMAEAQRLVAHAGGSAENTQQAKAGVESAIHGFYSEVMWNGPVAIARWDQLLSASKRLASGESANRGGR
ncbi:MAG: hypothetical protein ACLP9L_07200 [Thermoguttaceae bacterium]